MSTIANTLLAGSYLCSVAGGVFLILAIVLQAIRNNKIWESRIRAPANNPNPSRFASAFAAIYDKPSMYIDILALAGVTFFVKAIAYWSMFYGVGVTGGNYWGEQLSWIISFFFIGKALTDYLCLKPDWKFVAMYAVAAIAGPLFVAAFAPAANQLAFVLLAGGWFLITVVAIWMFRDRMSTCKNPDMWATIILVSFIVVFLAGYYVPYIISPSYVFAISTAATLIWYLCADFVVLVWFIVMSATALDCAEITRKLAAEATPTPMKEGAKYK